MLRFPAERKAQRTMKEMVQPFIHGAKKQLRREGRACFPSCPSVHPLPQHTPARTHTASHFIFKNMKFRFTFNSINTFLFIFFNHLFHPFSFSIIYFFSLSLSTFYPFFPLSLSLFNNFFTLMWLWLFNTKRQ